MSFTGDRVKTLPREQGARAKPRSYWTDGATARERSRNPWDPRNYPKSTPVIPRVNPFEQPMVDPDRMQPWERRVWERERRGRQWAQRATRFGRAVGHLGRAWTAIELIDAFSKGVRKDRYAVEIAGMRMCDGIYNPTADYLPTNGLWFAPGSLDCNPGQLGGQGFGSGFHIPFLPDAAPVHGSVYPGRHITFSASSLPNQLMVGHTRAGGARWQEHSSWLKTVTGNPSPWFAAFKPIMVAQPLIQPAVGNALNPNIVRWMPMEPQPLEVPQIGTGRVAPQPFGDVIEQLSPQAQEAVGHVPAVYGFTVTAPIAGTDPETQPKPMPATPLPQPAPAAVGVRERKVFTRSRQLVVMLFKALDTVSEWGDVIDAVYEALPKDVTKRWKCDRRALIVDTFGQYGISNADCKLQALYHNWHRLDVQRALALIIMNEVEDKAYGTIHKFRDKRVPRTDYERQMWKEFGKWARDMGFAS